MIARVTALAVVVVLAGAAPALACSSCFYGAGNGLGMYVATAAFMSVLPLAMVGGLALWLRRRARTDEAVEAAEMEREDRRQRMPVSPLSRSSRWARPRDRRRAVGGGT